MDKEPEKITSPHGEIFAVSPEATNRIMNEGIPFVMVDIKEKKLAVKEGNLFLYTSTEGNIPPGNTSGLGFYREDTRFLSSYQMKLNGRDPILLSSSAARNYMAHIELTNTDIWQAPDSLIAEQDTINIRRKIILKDCLYEQIRVKNYNTKPAKLKLDLGFSADFSDIFEIRGQKREGRGKIVQPKFSNDVLTFGYLGQDDIFRQTIVSFSDSPDSVNIDIDRTSVVFDMDLAPHGRAFLEIKIEPRVGKDPVPSSDYSDVSNVLAKDYDIWREDCTNIATDNELFNEMIDRGASDIRALLTDTEYGKVFDAGIPWFTSPFGRDSLITARETLLLNSEPARHCLGFLAKLQATEHDTWRDAQPGKIMHELRRGELALSGQIPHTPYYGSVDSTPLFLILFKDYYDWSGDKEFVVAHKQNIMRAVEWLTKWADMDNDGFIEYIRAADTGLENQGWKDSAYSVTHTDGRKALAPIALSEVQGYAYHAKRSAARLLQIAGEYNLADELHDSADKLKKLFNEKFWMEEEGFFAMALDANKEQVKSITTNPGHCLWSGIADEDKGKKAGERLLEQDMFSGWGIRTLSKQAINYNPMSYHNGSVWPQDNILVAFGLKKYGLIEQFNKVITSLFGFAQHEPYSRLPELFCGFTRKENNLPTEYPVACSPQAWASGSVFLMLEALLGLQPDAQNNTLHINNPTLPDWLDRVQLRNIKIGNSAIDLIFKKEDDVISFKKLEKRGKLKIIMEE